MLSKLNNSSNLIKLSSFALTYGISLTGIFSGKGSFALELALAVSFFLLLNSIVCGFFRIPSSPSFLRHTIGIDFLVAIIGFEFWINPYVKGFPREFVIFCLLWGILYLAKSFIIKE
jgi:hypothetical protein